MVEGAEAAVDTKEGNVEQENNRKKKKGNRSLKTDERLLFAPQCNIGVLSFDETGGYVTIPEKYIVFTRRDGEDKHLNEHAGVKMIRELQETTKRIDEEFDNVEVDLIEGMALEEEKEEVDVSEFKDFAKSLKQISNMAEKISGTEGITAEKSNFVNLEELIYATVEGSNEYKTKLDEVMDCSKFVNNVTMS